MILSLPKDSRPSFLPENVDESTYGRFTKWAAYALLAKMYIMRRCKAGTPQWQKVSGCLGEIIKSGQFRWREIRKDVFKADNEDCSEATFVPFGSKKVTPVD